MLLERHAACAKTPRRIETDIFANPRNRIRREYPIHDVAMYNHTKLTMMEVLRAWPEGATARDGQDFLPLHHAVAGQAKRATLRGSRVPGRGGDGRPGERTRSTPSCESDAPSTQSNFSSTRTRVRAATRVSAPVIGLPLHLAARYGSFDAIRIIADAHRPGARTRDGDGRLPLHVAVAARRSPDVIRFLVRVHPDGVREADDRGNLPVNLMQGGELARVLTGGGESEADAETEGAEESWTKLAERLRGARRGTSPTANSNASSRRSGTSRTRRSSSWNDGRWRSRWWRSATIGCVPSGTSCSAIPSRRATGKCTSENTSSSGKRQTWAPRDGSRR